MANNQVERLALADAMNLHNERVQQAEARYSAAISELESAQSQLGLVRQSREVFRESIRSYSATAIRRI